MWSFMSHKLEKLIKYAYLWLRSSSSKISMVKNKNTWTTALKRKAQKAGDAGIMPRQHSELLSCTVQYKSSPALASYVLSFSSLFPPTWRTKYNYTRAP